MKNMLYLCNTNLKQEDMKKYKLIGRAKSPKRNTASLTIQEYKMMQRDDDFAIDMLLSKYAIDSNKYMYEDCISTYILDEDTDGIYLYCRVD